MPRSSAVLIGKPVAFTRSSELQGENKWASLCMVKFSETHFVHGQFLHKSGTLCDHGFCAWSGRDPAQNPRLFPWTHWFWHPHPPKLWVTPETPWVLCMIGSWSGTKWYVSTGGAVCAWSTIHKILSCDSIHSQTCSTRFGISVTISALSLHARWWESGHRVEEHLRRRRRQGKSRLAMLWTFPPMLCCCLTFGLFDEWA